MARFVYLISPKRLNNNFYIELSKVLKSKKVKYFQLRLKGQKDKYVLDILKKVKKDVDIKLNRYPIDKALKQKLPFWKIPFLMKLLQEWKEYDTNGIDIPEAVRAQTKSYRNDNDVVGQWIDQCCEIADYVIGSNKVDKYAPSEFDDLYRDFKEWCDEQEMRKPDKKTTREALLKWQGKSSYGIDISKSMSDKCVHGTYTNPKFNLKVRND